MTGLFEDKQDLAVDAEAARVPSGETRWVSHMSHASDGAVRTLILDSAETDSTGGEEYADLQTVDRFRTVFPETWLWTDTILGYQ